MRNVGLILIGRKNEGDRQMDTLKKVVILVAILLVSVFIVGCTGEDDAAGTTEQADTPTANGESALRDEEQVDDEQVKEEQVMERRKEMSRRRNLQNRLEQNEQDK